MTTPKRARRTFIKRLAAGAVALPAVAGDALAAEKKPKGTAARAEAFAFNVRDFGAVPDATTLSTVAIQKAIDACGAAGGGRVVVPPGKFLTTPLFLKSNLELELAAGATLLGATKIADYPSTQGRWEGINRTIYASLLTGHDLENVAITGRGTLDGQGPVWWEANRKTGAMRRELGLTAREPDNPPGAPLQWPRPRMINIYRSKNVTISGITILNSPSWTVHPVLCDGVWIDGIVINNPDRSPNTDGIDPDSCRNVRISDCYLNCGDDCIIIKSGYKHATSDPLVPSENITITNCVFGIGIAGVGIGSETAGGVRNVAISNCVCDGTRRGVFIKSARGRGNTVENVRITNFTMRNVIDTGIYISQYYVAADRGKPKAKDDETPTFRHIYCNDVTISGVKRAVVVEGLPENPIQSVGLRDIAIENAATGMDCSAVRGFSLENVAIDNAEGPAITLRDVHDLELLRFGTGTPHAGVPVVRMEQVQRASVQGCAAASGCSSFVEVKGAGSSDITFALNRLPKDVTEAAFVDGASAEVVTRRG